VVGEVSLAAAAPTEGTPVASPGGAGGIGGGGAGTILADPSGDGEAKNARPDPSPTGGGKTGTDDEDDECVPVKDYGPSVTSDRIGRPQGIYARFCDKVDLEGGTPANPGINPPGWPEKDGRTANPKVAGRYVYSRCHLLGDQLVGTETSRRIFSLVSMTSSMTRI
jgi:hypothetical protein